MAVFSPDDTRVGTACLDGTARILGRCDGEEINILHGHKGGMVVRSDKFA